MATTPSIGRSDSNLALNPPSQLEGPSPSPTPSHDPSHEEHQYLNLIRTIISTGEHRPDRTGTGTRSIFAPPQLRFSLSKPSSDPSNPDPVPVLPLLTTKRVFLRAVIAELLWFVSGCTSSLPLSEAGIKIWDGNGSREFLDSVGLSHREVGDLGPVRIILSAWNPADLKKMALPPCHMFAQFYVSFPPQKAGDEGKKGKGTLSCVLYQRSCDMGLGVPFNIASYALLTHMFAHAADLHPGTFIHTMGDAHVYLDHIEALQEQLTREPTDFPTLKINRTDRGSGEMDGWKDSDFEVLDYKPHKLIKMKMSI
ncbi:thymidylate synthase [Trichophyton equinum CBS 127.97]|uniref:thymidylate synthase n=1 Tax=Trichophyton equinum (strain ATCC MYA-4606 / CBS 127.97) TaxID=559882 RepID=F2PZD7_TRIEC|nr:thymidylate synthase [Trichophyton equinum CBS 127.97]